MQRHHLKMDLKMDLVENPWHIRLDKVLEIVHKVLEILVNLRLRCWISC